jgi:hypothetical protein
MINFHYRFRVATAVLSPPPTVRRKTEYRVTTHDMLSFWRRRLLGETAIQHDVLACTRTGA